MYYYEDDYRPLQERMEENEEKVFNYITTYIKKSGYGPTVREIKSYLGCGSTSTAYNYLKRLKNKGKVTWEPKKLRTLTVVDNKSSAS